MIWNQPFLREPIVPTPRPIESTRLNDLGLVGGFLVCCAVVFYCALLCCCAVVMGAAQLCGRAWALLCSLASPSPSRSGACPKCHGTQTIPDPNAPTVFNLGQRCPDCRE